jgi:Transposase DDE domain
LDKYRWSASGTPRSRRPQRGAELCANCKQTVEPVFGYTKYNRAFLRFMRRGQAAADAEWALINMTHNLLKLLSSLHDHRHVPAT